MKVYCISGLGANHSVFESLQLNDEKVPVHWEPTHYGESMEDYAKKLSKQVKTDEPFVLLGVSFGGMLAVEMCKHISPTKTILISSTAVRKELPGWVRMAGIMRLHRLIPSTFYTLPPWLVIWFLGVKSQSRKSMMRQIIENQDRPFLKQCIHKVLLWKNKFIPENLYRIHGTKDYLLPAPKNAPYLPLPKGGHFAIVENASDISRLINEILAKES